MVGTAQVSKSAVATYDLVKVFGGGDYAVRALDGISVEFAAGGFTAVMGPSGSGKSTLMYVMAGLDKPTSGRVVLDGTDISQLKERELTLLRREAIGFIFQAYNLVPTLTAAENVTLPVDLAGRKVDKEWFDRVIDAVGLRDRLRHKPAELSGGQQQRVAAARSLVGRPRVVFADEPTGALDSKSSDELLEFMRSMVDDFGQTIVMVTHDPFAASFADRIVFLDDGQSIDEMRRPTVDAVLDKMKSLGEVIKP